MRTSETHPLRVGNGLLGLTFCPGKRGDSVYGAPWARDLDTDLSAIRGWGAGLSVSVWGSVAKTSGSRTFANVGAS